MANRAERRAAKRAAKQTSEAELIPLPALAPFPMHLTSLYQQDRQGLVVNSGIPGVANHNYVNTNLFEVTALGANLDLDGHWAPAVVNPRNPNAPGSNIAAWRQVTTSGRDQHVQVVHRGYLFPLGLEAVLIEVTERDFVPAPDTGVTTGYLVKRTYIKVIQPTKHYPAFGAPHQGRSWPFQAITAVTLQTPPIDQKVITIDTGLQGQSTPDTVQYFIPSVGGQPFDWTLHALDSAGHAVTLSVPLVFIQGQGAAPDTASQFDPAAMATVAALYDNLDATLRTSQTGGVSLQFAPEDSTVPGGTTHPTTSITLGASPPDPSAKSTNLAANNQVAFYPTLATASVRLPAVEALTRQTLDSPGALAGAGVAFSYFDSYLQQGFDTAGQNLGKVYAQMLDAVPMGFPTDAVGGLLNPAGALSGLSAIAGSITGEIQSYADTAKAEALDYFNNLKAQALSELMNFLGGLPLVSQAENEVNAVQGIIDGFLNDEVPKITQLYDEVTARREISYDLTATLTPYPSGDSPIFQPTGSGDDNTLTVNTLVVIDPQGTSSATTTGTVSPFQINLLPGVLNFITIPFEKVAFTAKTGQKTKVDLEIGQVVFTGDFSFINSIEQLLSDLGGDGLAIDVTTTQVSASLDLALPALVFGVFSLANLQLFADMTIPFLSGPAVAHFAIASQEQPFNLTVAMFGGGGYLSLGLGMAEVQTVTVSLDFEGSFALDVVVASGGVSIAAGLTYNFDESTGTKLTAFVNIHGEVEVLGLVSISLELDVDMSYVNENGTGYVQGSATMHASIDIAFFSASVPITVTKQFGNGAPSSQADSHIKTDSLAAGNRSFAAAAATAPTGPTVPAPVTTFQDQMSADDWVAYCGAFV